MDFDQLGSRVTDILARHENLGLPEDMTPIRCIRATEGEISQAERALGVRLPDQYKDFMLRYGGGAFMSLDILPVVSKGSDSDLVSVNLREESFDVPFVAVAPVGTGDWWGFQVDNLECSDQVSFYSFEDGAARMKYEDFLQFIAREGLLIENS